MSNEDNKNNNSYKAVPTRDPDTPVTIINPELQINNNNNNNNNNNINNNNNNPSNNVDVNLVNSQTNNSRSRERIIGNMCYLMYSLMLAITWYWLFHVFSTNSTHFNPSEQCKALVSTSKGVASYYYYMIILLALLLIFTPLQTKTYSFSNCLVDFLSLIYLTATFICIIVYVILMTSAVSRGSDCGDLNTLALVWLILFYIAIVILCGFMLCVICITGITVGNAVEMINNRR
jgi:hypothetical protein